ncbi:hypothetical protein FXO38_17802 [Capsicum annuum]|nr:hypothetical protein FXO37_20067 [Capsicum annuum]KAF3649183.1 hypothetical protein FXO38_17802 [Capsicum annuum]
MFSKTDRAEYFIDPNVWFTSNPRWRGDSNYDTTIMSFLNDNQLSLLEKGVFIHPENNAGAEDLLPYPLVEEFSKSFLYSQLQGFGGIEVDGDCIDGTKNYGNQLGAINVGTEDMISNVNGTKKFVNVDSTICNVEISHDEQEITCISPLKSKGSPLKPKGSPLKNQTYIRRKKGSKSSISDIASELNSRRSSMEEKVKDATPKKSIRQKFVGQLAESPCVKDFDLGASQSIFYQKYPFICDIEAFDKLSSLNTDFWAFIECGLKKSKW